MQLTVALWTQDFVFVLIFACPNVLYSHWIKKKKKNL